MARATESFTGASSNTALNSPLQLLPVDARIALAVAAGAIYLSTCQYVIVPKLLLLSPRKIHSQPPQELPPEARNQKMSSRPPSFWKLFPNKSLLV